MQMEAFVRTLRIGILPEFDGMRRMLENKGFSCLRTDLHPWRVGSVWQRGNIEMRLQLNFEQCASAELHLTDDVGGGLSVLCNPDIAGNLRWTIMRNHDTPEDSLIHGVTGNIWDTVAMPPDKMQVEVEEGEAFGAISRIAHAFSRLER